MKEDQTLKALSGQTQVSCHSTTRLVASELNLLDSFEFIVPVSDRRHVLYDDKLHLLKAEGI